MANQSGNPNIAEFGRATRFGAGRNCPRQAQAQARRIHDIGQSLRRLAGVTFEVSVLNKKHWTAEFILRYMPNDNQPYSLADYAAARLFAQAMNGDTWALGRVTDLIDGPLRSRKPKQEKSLAELIIGASE